MLNCLLYVVSDFEPPVVMSDTKLPQLYVAQKKMYLLTCQIISLMFWEVICVIDYKQKQGLVNSNEEINSLSLYYPALIKHMEAFCLI
jgi:hypothetical protein